MYITPQTERALIDLANRGLWLTVEGNLLRVIAVREEAARLSDDLRQVLAAHKTELIDLVPALESPEIELTGPVVRILYARLPSELQRCPGISCARFYDGYSDRPQSERVAYLWWRIDGPIDEINRLSEVIAA